jgi:hypothetical protein
MLKSSWSTNCDAQIKASAPPVRDDPASLGRLAAG